MSISERQLMEFATGYIENGILKKWRYSSEYTQDIDRVLSDKQYSGEELTEDEIRYAISHDNVVLIKDNIVYLNNFTARIFDIS